MNSIKAQEKRFSEFFSNRIDFMLHQSVGLSKLDHKGLRGRFRELLVRDLFEYLVPRT